MSTLTANQKISFILALCLGIFLSRCKAKPQDSPCEFASNSYYKWLFAKMITGDRSQHCGIDYSFPVRIQFKNLKDKSVLNSGYILGTTESLTNRNIISMEASLDGGEFAKISGTTSWIIPLPNGSATWKDSSIHKISVRARDNADRLSETVIINVRKGQNRDINGDGYPDMAIGASGILAQQGIVYIFYGGSSGIAATSPSQANVSISGKAGSDQFGSYLTIGDLNGDGFGDLMVGAFGRNAGAGGGQGEVYIFHGSKNGITITSAFAANTTLTASSAGDNLGGGVMFISDINGDGFGDAVVGITGGPTANNNGQIVIFHGSSSGIASTTNPAGSANTTLTGLATNEGFGVGLDCADLNGDGFSDLVAGSLFRNAGAGANQGEAYIFYGKSSGISSGLASTANITMTGSGSGLKFGSTVSVNDYNGDNFLDFAIGGSGYSAGTGKVYIFNGSSAGFSSKNSDNADVIITGSTAAENFGFSSASGDFNGDGFADLVVGANLFTTSQGRAYIFHGSATGIAVTNSSSASTIITGISSNDQTGETVSSLYLNGDGFSDLLVGSSNYSAGNAQGRVYIFNGMSAGIPSGTASAANNIVTGISAADKFGKF